MVKFNAIQLNHIDYFVYDIIDWYWGYCTAGV